MATMDPDRMADLLGGPHQAVLSVSRRDRGPVAVPMSYHLSGGDWYLVTSPDSLHGRLMSRRGRATITVQFEACDGRSVHQWYVMAEGPIQFTDLDPRPHIRAILAKDRGADNVDEWTRGPPPADVRVAVLAPERMTGYEFHESLDA
jgi:nitroimidazol reductase NimA-like FMN-containing flavoprotein (pyridoxamine 5'-phosphate oxidase superfamily)